MTDHNQKLEPTDFQAATVAPEASDARQAGDGSVPGGMAPRAAPNQWLLPALLGLLVIALLVFFWLPERVGQPQLDIESARQAAAGDGSPTGSAAAEAQDQPAPWQDAQLQRQRKAAQEVLAELLDEQFTLEEMQVQRWAPEAFAAAQGLASAGDELYKQRAFEEAMATYQQGLEAMLAIGESAAAIFAERLAAGEQALLANDPAAALAALEIALLLRPDEAAAQRAMARAGTLEEVLATWASARQLREQGELEQAQALLREASGIDPAHAAIRADLAAVGQDILRRDFNQAMTRGYQAMDGGDFAAAERHFQQARRIMPDAPEIDGALMEARTGKTGQQIARWQDRARTAEANEDWDGAAEAYRKILAIDNTVVFARDGAARSDQRLELDKQVKLVLGEPARLTDERIYARTRDLYQSALGLPGQGPRLKRQLGELGEVLRLARTPIPVLLQSDELTDVTVYRVAHLGTFRRQQLELNPGTYTAVGVRNGYRDVRRKFTLAHGEQAPSIEITCTEPI
jgi:tetratricopeptide (TPR) repeat protein